MVASSALSKVLNQDRADTPMTAGDANPGNTTSSRHSSTSNGSSMTRRDGPTPASSGFTAVNSDTIVVAVPNKHLTLVDTSAVAQDTDHPPSSTRTHGWRSSDVTPTENGHSPIPSKRKRQDVTGESVGDADDQRTREAVSSLSAHKRRITSTDAPKDVTPAVKEPTPPPTNGHSRDRPDSSHRAFEKSPPSRAVARPRLITTNVNDSMPRHMRYESLSSADLKAVSSTTETSKEASPRLTSSIALSSSTSDRRSTTNADERPRRSATHMEQRIGPYSREPSPRPMNKAGPRPTVRPETEADLAASLHRELHGTSQSPTQPSPTAPEESSPSPAEDRFSPEAHSPPSPERDAQASDEAKKRKRTFSNRTKTGCHTCRQRKKKCDERKPTCHNCERGGFSCTGYGPKPPHIKPVGTAQRMIALQSKAFIDHPQHSTTGHYFPPPHPSEDVRRYPPWPRQHPGEYEQPGRVMDHRHPPYQDPWGPRPYWTGREPHPSQHGLPLSAGPHAGGPPPPPPPPPPSQVSAHPPQPPPPPPPVQSIPHHNPDRERSRPYPPDVPPHAQMYHHPPEPQRHSLPPPPPPPPPSGLPEHEHWGGSNSLPSAHSSAYQFISSRDSVATSGSSSRTLQTQDQYIARRSRRDMILGQPFCYYTNQTLLADRQNCRGALERYNDAAKPSSYVSAEERGRFFRAVVDPSVRPGHHPSETMDMPCGNVGSETVVESPFTCDFGYNIHLGHDVIIQPGCYMQDPCEIRIGNRTVIGPNVRFYGLTTSVDPMNRKGVRARFYGGAIVVEDDVMIGGDVIIMPFRTIGRGSVIGAGSVVTKDVRPYSIVCGNPAEEIRECHAGRTSDRHKSDVIQSQNDRMLHDMQTRYEETLEQRR